MMCSMFNIKVFFIPPVFKGALILVYRESKLKKRMVSCGHAK